MDEGSCGKRDPEKEEEEMDEAHCGKRDQNPQDDKKKKKVNESKTPQPKSEQSNEDWYWGSLYSKLKDKWAK